MIVKVGPSAGKDFRRQANHCVHTVRFQTLRCRLDILVRLRFDGQECPSYAKITS